LPLSSLGPAAGALPVRAEVGESAGGRIVSALDYQFDVTAAGRLLKALYVLEQFSREASR
jgi:hypothetical protein